MKNPVYVENANTIQKEIQRVLKPLGFRRKGRVFNRVTADGLVQAIGMQLGQYELGVDDVFPGGPSSSFYGRFTINLGVIIPCVNEMEHGALPREFYQDYQGQIRARVGHLAFGKDTWWELSKDPRLRAPEIIALVESHGLAFLERYGSHDAILARYEEDGELPFSNPARSALVVALIYMGRNDAERARYFMMEAKRLAVLPAFYRYVDALAVKLGVLLE